MKMNTRTVTKESESQSRKGPRRLGDWALILRLTFVELHYVFPEILFLLNKKQISLFVCLFVF